MKTVGVTWTAGGGWCRDGDPADAHLVIYFAAPSALATVDVFAVLAAMCPRAHVVGCSTGGEIAGCDVADGSVAAVAVTFAGASVNLASRPIDGPAESQEVGAALAALLPADGLRGVFVLADGMRTNGTALVAGLRQVLPAPVLLTGGLAGDGPDFKRTLVGGASQAGVRARQPEGDHLALLVSCIGRKLLMGQRVADEVEAAAGALGKGAHSIGFYSYGEIAPHGDSGRCELHNQTMTITTIGED